MKTAVSIKGTLRGDNCVTEAVPFKFKGGEFKQMNNRLKEIFKKRGEPGGWRRKK